MESNSKTPQFIQLNRSCPVTNKLVNKVHSAVNPMAYPKDMPAEQRKVIIDEITKSHSAVRDELWRSTIKTYIKLLELRPTGSVGELDRLYKDFYKWGWSEHELFDEIKSYGNGMELVDEVVEELRIERN